MSQLHGNNVSSSSNKEKLEEDNLKVIGPALPSHIINKVNIDTVSSTSSNNDDCTTNYSEETHCSVIGPILPPHLLDKVNSKSNSEETQNNMIGPFLPPHLLNKANPDSEEEYNCEESSTTEDVNVNVNTPDSSSNNTYGPALPPHLQKPVEEDSDDEDAYGPLPPGASTSSLAHQALEERALQIKLGQFDTNETKAIVREEWMMELPEVRAGNLGLGPRQFRKNERPDFSDRSSWTDTPEQKVKKLEGKTEKSVDLKKEAELQQIIKRDDEQSKLIEKHNKKKKRDKSLVEMHQDQLKKKKKEDEKDGITRRPFNRDIDLKVNQFDDAQKKSIMKKAMHLDDRFSRGQSKFL